MTPSLKLASIFILINIFSSMTNQLPVLERNDTYVNSFVGFYVFPHGGITLDPAHMDYSEKPAFSKVSSKQEAINLHEAMQKAADSLIQSSPDLIIFSTPHVFSLSDGPVILKVDKVTLPEPCDPNKLLPSNPAYWTYFGSLTTPPFSESVIWLVFKQPVEVSLKQLELMRNLRCYDVNEPCPCDGNGKVINNYRPTLPLGNRELREIGGH